MFNFICIIGGKLLKLLVLTLQFQFQNLKVWHYLSDQKISSNFASHFLSIIVVFLIVDATYNLSMFLTS